MGTRTSAAGSKNYYSVIAGKFRSKKKEKTENTVERENKNGKIIHEVCVDEMYGKILKIYFNKNDHGHFLNIDFHDGDVLSFSLDSRLSGTFMKILPNIDLSKEVSIKTWLDDDDNNAFYVSQNGESVKWAFTRENPNGMPGPVEKTVKGDKKWDFSDQENFLYENTLKIVNTFEGESPASADDFQDMEPKEEMPF